MIEKGKAAHQFFNKLVGPDGKVTYSLKPMEQYMKVKRKISEEHLKYVFPLVGHKF